MERSAHVQISGTSRGDRKVVVDGVDMTKVILAEGFGISGLEGSGEVHIHMTLVAGLIEIDLPDAVLSAIKHDETESEPA